MTLKDEIVHLCQCLVNEGKKPSIALIKARLSAPAPLPNIIAGLKSWQQNPEQLIESDTNNAITKTSTLSAEDIVKRIDELQLELLELKSAVKVLMNNGQDTAG